MAGQWSARQGGTGAPHNGHGAHLLNHRPSQQAPRAGFITHLWALRPPPQSAALAACHPHWCLAATPAQTAAGCVDAAPRYLRSADRWLDCEIGTVIWVRKIINHAAHLPTHEHLHFMHARLLTSFMKKQCSATPGVPKVAGRSPMDTTRTS